MRIAHLTGSVYYDGGVWMLIMLVVWMLPRKASDGVMLLLLAACGSLPRNPLCEVEMLSDNCRPVVGPGQVGDQVIKAWLLRKEKKGVL